MHLHPFTSEPTKSSWPDVDLTTVGMKDALTKNTTVCSTKINSSSMITIISEYRSYENGLRKTPVSSIKLHAPCCIGQIYV